MKRYIRICFDYIVKTLSSNKFYTIVATIIGVLSFVFSLRECSTSDAQLCIGNKKISNEDNLTLYYICSPDANIVKYILPFPITLVNNTNKTISNLHYSVECKMKIISERALMTRFVDNHSQHDKKKHEWIIPQHTSITPHTNLSFLHALNVVNEKKIVTGIFDDFYFDINIVYEGIEAALNKKVHIVALFCENYEEWRNDKAQILSQVQKRFHTDDNEEGFVILTENTDTSLTGDGIGVYNCSYLKNNSIIKIKN